MRKLRLPFSPKEAILLESLVAVDGQVRPEAVLVQRDPKKCLFWQVQKKGRCALVTPEHRRTQHLSPAYPVQEIW